MSEERITGEAAIRLHKTLIENECEAGIHTPSKQFLIRNTKTGKTTTTCVVCGEQIEVG